MTKQDITKSLFVLGERCLKAFYLQKKFPELEDPLSSQGVKTLELGKEVGIFARKTFPGGTLIDEHDIEKAIDKTKALIDQGVLTLYEATFRYGDLLVKVDILNRASKDSPWEFYEVKATTYNKCREDQKQEYRNDIGIQVLVLQKLNIPLDRISLMHLNSECRYPDLSNLFAYEDYSQEIKLVLASIEEEVIKLDSVVSKAKEPSISIGRHCENPRDCPFKSYCWKEVPKPSVFNIPNCRKKWDLFAKGSPSIDNLSVDDFSSASQKRAFVSYRDTSRYFDKENVSQSLNAWNFPLSFLDFESIDYPIPRFENTKTFQHLPFQFSCHIKKSEKSPYTHVEFLHESQEDPRPSFIQELIQTVPKKGSVVVYHATYESTRLKELAADFPEYKEELLRIKERLVDLEVVIKNGVYHPGFMGSYSIKKVAPAILGKDSSYENLDIGDGVQASLAFKTLTNLPHHSSEKMDLKKSMLEYCKQDTLVMVKLYEWLQTELISSISCQIGLAPETQVCDSLEPNYDALMKLPYLEDE